MATTIGVTLWMSDVTPDELTAGIGDFAPADTRWVQIKGVQNIPELQTAPSTIDVTSLEDTEEQAEPGLISGSSLAITMNYKAHVYKEATNVEGDFEDGSNFEYLLDRVTRKSDTSTDPLWNPENIYAWEIRLPNGRYFRFFGKHRVTVGAMGVAAALQFMLTLYKRSKVQIGYDPDLAVQAMSLNADVIRANVKKNTSLEEDKVGIEDEEV